MNSITSFISFLVSSDCVVFETRKYGVITSPEEWLPLIIVAVIFVPHPISGISKNTESGYLWLHIALIKHKKILMNVNYIFFLTLSEAPFFHYTVLFSEVLFFVHIRPTAISTINFFSTCLLQPSSLSKSSCLYVVNIFVSSLIQLDQLIFVYLIILDIVAKGGEVNHCLP